MEKDNTLNNFIILCRSCKSPGIHITHWLEGISLRCKNCGYEAEILLSPIGPPTHNLTSPIQDVFPNIKIEKGIN